ncbi:D-serine deaminase-like pyridoxal phosphate-dependent protein [Sphingomonas prati]|uniref:D-serine deaminase-like pyridoxal phosphate-dependent protein n=1 Tax=Sphingomonas prati TaxID=1843237 RepID=A0A7W9BQH9_9SPHN|nr:D-serine deaminase-like pyridoxal phosphate-dependent protein [Sphingomonas prati]
MLCPKMKAFQRLLSIMSDDGVMAVWHAVVSVPNEERILLMAEMRRRNLAL